MSPFLDFVIFATLLLFLAIVLFMLIQGIRLLASSFSNLTDAYNYWMDIVNNSVRRIGFATDDLTVEVSAQTTATKVAALVDRDNDIVNFMLDEDTLHYSQDRFQLETGPTTCYSYPEFINTLTMQGYLISVVTEVCSWKRSSCRRQLKLVSNSGTIYYLSTFCDNRYLVTGEIIVDEHMKQYLTKTTKGLGLSSEKEIEPLDNPDDVSLIGSIACFNSPTLLSRPNTDVKNITDDILAAIDASKITLQQTIHRSKSTTVRHCTVEWTMMGPVVREHVTQVNVPPTKVMNDLYTPVNFEYEGKKHSIRMGHALPVLSTLLQERKHFALFGVPGTGKTTLLKQLGANLYRNSTLFVYVSPTALSGMSSDNKLSDNFTTMLDRINIYAAQNDYSTITIAIDEAERLMRRGQDGFHTDENTMLLQALDGSTSDKYPNISYAMIFNAPKELMDPAFFRAGRLIDIEMKAISRSAAVRAIPYLRASMSDKIFNAQKFEAIVSCANIASDGSVYAEEGTITLADLTQSCFIGSQTNDAIAAAIKAAMKQDEKDTAPVSAPSISVPKKVITVPSLKPQHEAGAVIVPIATPSRKNPNAKNRQRNKHHNNTNSRRPQA